MRLEIVAPGSKGRVATFKRIPHIVGKRTTSIMKKSAA
jgi:hypothetical protein